MDKREDAHLLDEQLLLHADGELSGHTVREHLDACWSCRARLDDLQATINSVARFRNEVLLPGVPPPPDAWPGLRPRIEALDEQIRGRSVLQRVRAVLKTRTTGELTTWPSSDRGGRQALAIAAMVVLAMWLGTDSASAAAARSAIVRFAAFVSALVRQPAPESRPSVAVASKPPAPETVPTPVAPPVSPKTVAPVPVAAEALDDAELDIRLVLRDMDADLVPGIELRRTVRRVELRGHVDPPTRTLIRARLATVPHTAVRLLAAVPGREEAGSESGVSIGLLSWRLRTFRDAAAGESALRDSYLLAERVQRRAEAYHAVARRYESNTAGQLSDTAALKFQALIRAHHRALVSDLDTLDRELAVLLGWSPRRLLGEDIRSDWRVQAAASSEAARALSEAVRSLVAVPDIPLSDLEGASAPAEVSRVRRSLATLWRLFERS